MVVLREPAGLYVLANCWLSSRSMDARRGEVPVALATVVLTCAGYGEGATAKSGITLLVLQRNQNCAHEDSVLSNSNEALSSATYIGSAVHP
jgi:hypothetical protein